MLLLTLNVRCLVDRCDNMGNNMLRRARQSASADEEGNVVVAVSAQFGNPARTGMDIVTLKIGETAGIRFSGKVWLGDTG